MRLLGINLDNNKAIYIALTAIYGIGKVISNRILVKLNIPATKKVKDLTQKEESLIRQEIENSSLLVEGHLKKIEQKNIKRLIDIQCFRGKRHLRNLPCHGQRTKTNSRTVRKLKNVIN